jgi:hypothetical protein
VDACQSGSAVAAVHTAGLGGTVIAATDSAGYSFYYPLYYGSFFTHYFIQGWREGTDLNGDGQVDEKEAAAWAREKLLASSSVGAVALWNWGPVNPPVWSDLDGAGGLLKANDVRIFLDDPATNPGVIVIPRPQTAVGQWDWLVQVAQPQIANVAAGSPDSGSLADAGEIRIPVSGLSPGVTAYTFTSHDAQRKSYGAEGRILVGRGYLVSQDNVVLNVGQSATVTVYRSPALARAGAGTLASSVLETDSPSMVSVEGGSFEAGEDSTTVTITANRGGAARIRLTDPAGGSLELAVVVNGFWVAPNPVRLRAGQTVEATLYRSGSTGPLRIRAKANLDREVAAVQPEAPVEAAFPGTDNSRSIAVIGRSAGTALYDIEDDRGNKYELQIVVESAGTFVASAPVYTQTGDAQEGDVGVRNANGQLVPGHYLDVSFQGLDSLQLYDPAAEARPPLRRQASTEKHAVPVPPGGKLTVRTNSAGYLRMLYVAGPAGRATVKFESPAFGAVDYPIAVVARLANPPDQIEVTPPGAPLRVDSDLVLRVAARRNGLPVQDAVFTFHIAGGSFSDGSRFNNNTTSQIRTNSAGSATVTFRATAAGNVLIRVFAGQLAENVRLTAE